MLNNKTRDKIKEKFKLNKTTYFDDKNIKDFTKYEEYNISQYTNYNNINIIKDDNKFIDDYYYLGESSLNPGNPILKKDDKINIIIYNIDNTTIFPYIQFCLYRENNDLKMFNYNCSGNNDIKTIFNILNNEFKNLSYKGFYKDENTGIISIWFILNKKELKLQNGKYKDKLWWCLACELVNQKKTLSFNIVNEVSDFYIKNPEFLILKNNQGEIYETPTVGYYGNYSKRINFITIFGHKRENTESSFGPYYYFGSYKRAIRYAFWTETRKPKKINGKLITIDENGLYERGGIIKFALFLGKSHIEKLNSVNDIIKNKVKYDYTNWIYNYDSIIQIKKNKNINSDISNVDTQIIIKEYNQQIPLAYYYIDTKQNIKLDTIDKVIIE